MEQSTQRSRTITVVSIMLVLIVISLIVPLVWKGQPKKKQLKPRLDLSQIAKPKEVITDTNNDGIVSWREVMMTTTNPSSSTLAELKKIPVDKKVIDELNDPNNLTSSFAKNIYLAGVYLDKNGITDEQSKQEVVTKLMENERAKIITTTYSYKDITVAKKETKESLHAYGNKLAGILENSITEKSIVLDLQSTNSFASSKKESDLYPLVSNTKRIDAIVQKLLIIEVPPSAVIFHIIALKQITLYRDTVQALSLANKDPLKATLLLPTYPEVTKDVVRIPLQFSSYFTNKNIVFSSNEKGRIFTTGYTKTN